MTSILIIIINMKVRNWLPAPAAMALLGVRPQTLYANVSRGRIRARPDPADPRRSLYHGGDLRRLAGRARGRPRNEHVAQQAVSWGAPILPSALSTVSGGRLWYRGRDAVELAEHATLEEIAALLWELPQLQPLDLSRRWRGASPGRARGPRGRTRSRETPLQSAYRVLAQQAGRDAPMQGRALPVLRLEGLTLVAELARALLAPYRTLRRRHPRRAPLLLHQHLAEAWRRPAAAPILRRALVLLADHELNTSTFATRVAASTGAALSASVLAGFATLSGPMHGGAAAALQLLLDASQGARARQGITAWLAPGRGVAGFGHPLYPRGDVRAEALLRGLRLPPGLRALRSVGERLFGEPANVDFALVALSIAHDLPRDAPFVLFALARSVGWIAHALEQHQSASLLRPRARYSGPPLPQD